MKVNRPNRADYEVGYVGANYMGYITALERYADELEKDKDALCGTIIALEEELAEISDLATEDDPAAAP